MNRPRKPWLAGLLTVITTGLGHIYAGAPARGLILYVFGQTFVLVVLIVSLLTFPGKQSLALIAVLGIAFLVFCIYDAVRLARAARYQYPLKSYNRWYIYLLCWLATALVLQPLVGTGIKATLIQAYKIPSGAMTPTIQVGDQIIVKKGLLRRGTIQRGDIVIFPFPEDPSMDFIKRVVGRGGETLEIRARRVYIDGRALDEPYVRLADELLPPGNPLRDDFGPVQIPEDSLFVMGDNRNFSNDSRFWGFVPAASVTGRAFTIYWSWDKDNYSVRWRRIGKRIE